MLSLTAIDRTLFELIRLGVVSVNKLPDWTTFAGNQAAWEAAKDALRADEGELIEVFGTASAAAREAKTRSKIVINRTRINNGVVGAHGINYFIPTDDVFNKQPYPDSTTELIYEVRTITGNTANNNSPIVYDRLMAAVVLGKLGSRRWLKSWDGSGLNGEPFPIEFTGAVNVNAIDFLETVYTFRIADVWLETLLQPDNIIPTLTTINIELLGTDQAGTTFPINNITVE